MAGQGELAERAGLCVREMKGRAEREASFLPSQNGADSMLGRVPMRKPEQMRVYQQIKR